MYLVSWGWSGGGIKTSRARIYNNISQVVRYLKEVYDKEKDRKVYKYDWHNYKKRSVQDFPTFLDEFPWGVYYAGLGEPLSPLTTRQGIIEEAKRQHLI